MTPRSIPFDRYVWPITNNPTSMRLRLDFADWLGKNGHKPRAEWYRQVCCYCEDKCPLARSHPILGVVADAAVPFEMLIKERWEACRPDYWQEFEGVLQAWYFGRIVLSWASYPENLFATLGAAQWLPTAFRDGWLERLSCYVMDAEQIRTLLAWPQAHRDLPIHVNVTRCLAEGLDNGLLRGIISMGSLHGLTVCADEVGFPCMKKLGQTAGQLRYLSLLGLRRTGPGVRTIEQLSELQELRVLVIGDNLPLDDHIPALAGIPRLECLYLCGHDVTDAGLLHLSGMASLKTVMVNSRRVTRAGIYALREARPDVQVAAIDDLRARLGPV